MTGGAEPVAAFAFEVDVSADHIDELGHVNHKVYVAWAEAAGVGHWRAIASPELQAQWIWVASRIEMDFLRETLPGERVRVETWVEPPTGARFVRCVRIMGAAGVLKARARTTWALLDAKTRRPSRVASGLAALFSPPGAQS